MQGEIQQEQWQAYLDDFSKRNSGRMADLQIISEEVGTQREAEMLTFEGITLETKGSLASSVEIMLGSGGSADDRNLTHTITQVRRIVPKIGRTDAKMRSKSKPETVQILSSSLRRFRSWQKQRRKDVRTETFD